MCSATIMILELLLFSAHRIKCPFEPLALSFWVVLGSVGMGFAWYVLGRLYNFINVQHFVCYSILHFMTSKFNESTRNNRRAKYLVFLMNVWIEFRLFTQWSPAAYHTIELYKNHCYSTTMKCDRSTLSCLIPPTMSRHRCHQKHLHLLKDFNV